jgi:single-strand DNA-binding protein
MSKQIPSINAPGALGIYDGQDRCITIIKQGGEFFAFDAEGKCIGTFDTMLEATRKSLNVACGEGDATQWVSAMVFDERAIAVADKLVKGARVYLEGKLSQNEWTAQDGTTRSGLSVMSWHCRLSQIGRAKAKLEKPKPAPQSVLAGAAFDDEIPFAPERRG